MARTSKKNIDAAASAETRPAVKAWNTGAYVRLSAVDRKQKGDSIENQQAIIAAYCDERPELVIREVYIDNGLSGQKSDRPAFQKMLADMESGAIDCCISKDLSRYGRSAIDTGYYIEKFFPTHGIRCIAINDSYDSADGNSGGVMVSLKNLVNEHYALEIGRKIHTTKQMNIKNGLFVGAIPPYGYLKSKEDSHKLAPDPVAAPVVAKMFEMAASGNAVSTICRWLNDNGRLPPKKHFHSIGVASAKQAVGSDHWNVGAIYTILKNAVYCGDMIQGKGRTQSYDVTRLDKADWIITADTHEALVSRELFADVQKLWGKQGERAKPGRMASRRGLECADDSTAHESADQPADDNIFLRKIFCGHCSHAMWRTKSGKSGHTFKCDTRFRYNKDDCVPVSINEDTLKPVLLKTLREQAALYGAVNIAAPKSETVKEPSELANVRAELARLGGFHKGLYESLVSGDITQSEYADMKRSYETQIADLTERERVLTETARERHLNQIAINKASVTLGGVNTAADITAEVVDAMIDRILIFQDKRVEVRFKFTDEIATAGVAGND